MLYVYCGVFFITFVSTFKYQKDIFSPGRLYILVYSFLLAIDSFKLSAYQTPWSITTHLVFWGASFLFIAGAAVFGLLSNVKSESNEFSTSEKIKSQLLLNASNIDWNWFYNIWLIITLLFFITYAYGVHKTGFIPILTPEPDKSRILFLSSLITGIGWFFGPLSLMLVVEYFIFAKPTHLKKAFCIGISFIVLLLYSTIVTRLDLFRFFIFSVLLYHYGVKRLKTHHLLIVGLFGVAVFTIFFLIRMHANMVGSFVEALHMRMPRNLIWLAGIYCYVTNNFWNMDFALTKYIDSTFFYPQSWGYELFRPFFFALQVEIPMQNAYGFDSIYNESIMKAPGMNTIVYVWHFYKDFGVFGVYALTLLLSLLVAKFYQNMVRRPSVFQITIWSVFVGMIIFSFLVPLWSFWFTWMNIAVFAIAHKRIRL